VCGDLTFKRNIVWDTGAGGQNICLEGSNLWNNVDISYNVFQGTSEVYEGKSRGTLRSSNNVFYNAMALDGDGFEAVNNIYMAVSNYGPYEEIWGNAPRYSIYWDDGTVARGPIYDFQSGGGTNTKADPMFVDPAHPLGADGIPFTADDGFALRAGSPALHKGTATSDTTDIRGNPIVGAPDIGAY
jgi:hypothetical protein